MDSKILLRFDDICPTMNWEQWGKAQAILDAANVKSLLGVIPDNQDPDLMIDKPHADFWNILLELQKDGHTIAMHGYQHVFSSPHHGLLNYRMNSEFAGLPLEDQIVKIRRGKEILENHGIYTDVFFAPAHSYDENTLIALSECGFKYMSDGKSKKAYLWHGIKCLPFRNGGGANSNGRYSTYVYHAHEWVKKEKECGYYHLQDIVKKEVVSFDEYKRQPCGNKLIQQVSERLFVCWQWKIRRPLSGLKRKITH